jgi:hypothetical protein
MLFLLGLTFGAFLMALARRRADTIRLRVVHRLGERHPSSWKAWQHAISPPRFDRDVWWREPY